MSEKNANFETQNPLTIQNKEYQVEEVVVYQQQIPVTNNQNTINTNQIIFKSTPVFVICPKCGYNGLTRTVTTCSIANCLCCLFTDPICWCCFQLCRGKDLNCYDAVHCCPRCSAVLGNYSAC